MTTMTQSTTKPRFRMHGCERCQGDLLLDRDGCYACLQCGRVAPDEATLLAIAHLDMCIAAAQQERRAGRKTLAMV